MKWNKFLHSSLLMLCLTGACIVQCDESCAGCQTFQTVEIGTNLTTSCASCQMLKRYYWYRGSYKTTRPIVKLENGQKGGSEYGNGHYDITSSGEMVIINAQLIDEDTYTLVGIFDNRDSFKANITVNVTVSPESSCPEIDMCSSCQPCELTAKEEHIITCSVRNSRPSLPLLWNLGNGSGINFITYPAESLYNAVSGKWNTHITIKYIPVQCGERIIIGCVANDTYNLLLLKVTKVILKTDYCLNATAIPTDPEVQSNKSSWRIVLPLCIIAMAVTATSLTVYLIHRRNTKVKFQKVSVEEPGNAEAMQDVGTDEIDPVITCLVDHLKDYYKSTALTVPVGRIHSFDINQIFTDAHCIKQVGLQSDPFMISEIIDDEFILNIDRALFVGAIGFGKTTFSKHIVSRWLDMVEKKTSAPFLLIYMSSEIFQLNCDFFEEVYHRFDIKKTEMTKSKFENTLVAQGCLILFDGIDESSIADFPQCRKDTSNLKFLDIIQSTDRIPDTYGGIRVWVTSRIEHAGIFANRSMTVYLKGFGQDQKQRYFEKLEKLSLDVARTDKISEAIEKWVKEDEEPNFFLRSPLLISHNSFKCEQKRPTLTGMMRNTLQHMVEHSGVHGQSQPQGMDNFLITLARIEYSLQEGILQDAGAESALKAGIVKKNVDSASPSYKFSNTLFSEYYLALALINEDMSFLKERIQNRSKERSTCRLLLFLFGTGSGLINDIKNLLNNTDKDMFKHCLAEVDKKIVKK